MVHFTNINTRDQKTKELLDIHLNKLLRQVCGFMVAMEPDIDPEAIPRWLQNNALIKDTAWAIPIAQRENQEYIGVLLNKVFDDDTFYELTLDERYTMAKVICVGIQQEEATIRTILAETPGALGSWMNLYHMECPPPKIEQAGNAIKDHLKENGLWEPLVACVRDQELIEYEYPLALMRLFGEEDWAQLMAMQDFEEILKK